MSEKDSAINERLLVFMLAGVQFTHIMDFMVMMPLGPQLMRVLHIDARQFGLLVSSYMLTAALASFLSALYIDRFDRKKTLLFLYAGFVVSTLICGLAPGYGSLLAARAFAGAFGGVAGAAVFSIVGDAIPDARRGTATGTIMSAFSISAVAGVPTGLFLANRFDWHAPFLFLTAVSALVLFGIVKTVPSMRAHIHDKADVLQPLHQARAVFADANHRRAFTMTSILIFGGFSVVPFISPYMVSNVGLKETDLPYLYFFGGLVTAFSSRFIGRLSDRYGKREIFTLIALISILPLLLTTNLPPVPVWAAICVTVVFMVFVSGRFVPAIALVTSSAQPRLRGSVMSFNSALQQLASGLASFSSGFLIGHAADGALTHYGLAGLIATACTLIAVRLAWRVTPRS